jgi:hypothetical protein
MALLSEAAALDAPRPPMLACFNELVPAWSTDD